MLTRLVFAWLILFAAGGLLGTPGIAAAGDQAAASDGSPSITSIRTIDPDASPQGTPAESKPAAPAHAEPTLVEPALQPAAASQTPIPAALQAEAARPMPVHGPAPTTTEPSQDPTLHIVGAQPALGAADDPSQKLLPTPDAAVDGIIEIQTASFKGVTPGETKLAVLQEQWGSPKQMAAQNGQPVYLYSIDPFESIEVSVSDDIVTSVIIRLQQPVPAVPLAEQLKLQEIRPVLISNELGEILGQSYPERGVMFAFEPADEPGKATMRVVDVILEPVGAESFVLRAETYLDTHLTDCAKDLKTAIELQPELARAHWLQARVAASLGDAETALASSGQAIRLEPANPQFLVTRAQILGQAGKFTEARREVEAAAANAEKRPHVKARALCLLGDLISSEPEPDYSKALKSHMAAISEADPLVASPHPAIRLAAMEVLVDAHLGAAHDIAWGDWENKEVAVDTWLGRASAFAEGMIEAESAGPAMQFRVATRALASCVGARGKIDPTPWAEKAVQAGQKMIDSVEDVAQKNGIAWDLGLALYDAVQVYQMRDEQDLALKTGQTAIGLFEQGKDDQIKPSDAHLLARLYFRMGTIKAVAQSNHGSAVGWFDKALPLFQQAADNVAPHEVARLGETLVSMGVSYWEVGDRDRGLELTVTGVKLIEAAVEGRFVERSVLEVPYSNLATMHRQLGQTEKAEEYLRLASEPKAPVR